jgi:hypothetical protein
VEDADGPAQTTIEVAVRVIVRSVGA